MEVTYRLHHRFDPSDPFTLWTTGDYSVMQPSEPNATPLVFMTLTKASADIGALEKSQKTLLGASSFGLGGAALDNHGGGSA